MTDTDSLVDTKIAIDLSLIKPDPTSLALKVEGRDHVMIKAGTVFAGRRFASDTAVGITDPAPGTDYVIFVGEGGPTAIKATALNIGLTLGGFHLAPGGHATATSGGDEMPAVNPFSLWDRQFRPACPDPRGMAHIAMSDHAFWCDIYLTGVDHLTAGTSACRATIADGDDPPRDPATGHSFKQFDYATACAVMKHHGKGLLSFEEFAFATYGVTERSAARKNPEVTKLDAPRTSRFGLMQATGNMWVWGTDGHPDIPRASILGGSWLDDEGAGSRFAYLGVWAGGSDGSLGARGRSDHLMPV
jgi:hypothetical protein